jgi:hypothetical protein
MIARMQYDDNDGAAGSGDGLLKDLDWRERTGNDPERVYREALRRAIVLRDGGTPSRAVILWQVLTRLGELSAFDTNDLWGRD